MFIRDSSNTPREISKIFVRDALGSPQEISKIYVRNSSGQAILVFDNTTTVVPITCPNCLEGGAAYVYTVGGTTSNTPISGTGVTPCLSTPQQPPTSSCNTTSILSKATLPLVQIDKVYWSKTSIPYNQAKLNKGSVETRERFYTTLSQTLEQGCTAGSTVSCFCQLYGRQTQAANNPSGETQTTFINLLNERLLTAYNQTQNYPVLPGYIIVDYKTENAKSTIFILNKRPTIQWTSHGQNLLDVNGDTAINRDTGEPCVPDGAYNQDLLSTQTARTRATSIYPYHNKSVLLDFNPIQAADPETIEQYRCGQEYCGGIYGRDFFARWAQGDNCFPWPGGWTQNSFNFLFPGQTGANFCGFSEANNDVFSVVTSGFDVISPSNGSDCASGRVFVGSQVNGESGVIDGWSGVNPFSWILYAENILTTNSLPTTNSSADIHDCCKTCFYGPVPLGEDTTILDGCRHVYQIPPINTLNPPETKFKFLRDVIIGAAINSKDIDLSNPDITARTSIRITLPAYVTLHSNLKSKIVSMFPDENEIPNFVFAGPSSFGNTDWDTTFVTLNDEEKSVYNAISAFTGRFIKDSSILNDQDTINLSSSAFRYEENRFADPNGRPAGFITTSLANTSNQPLFGISGVNSAEDLGQYPLIWWSFSGYPTVNATHYVVLELDLSSDNNCATYINFQRLQIQANLFKLIKGISFYPIHFNCTNLNGSLSGSSEQITNHFIHPAFQYYLQPLQIVNNPDIVTGSTLGNGFLDIGLSSNQLPTDQGGAGIINWTISESSTLRVNSTIPNFYTFKGLLVATNLPVSNYSCLRVFNSFLTYKDFLLKFYRNIGSVPGAAPAPPA